MTNSPFKPGDLSPGLNIGRRRFLTTAAGIGTAALGATLITPGRGAFAAEPKKGGRLRIATTDSGPADTLDPATTNTFTDIIRSYIVFEKLTEFDSTGKLVPQLATAWSSNDTGTKWVFELRPGVVFHNGKKLTSADVAYTFQRVIDKKTNSNGAVFLTDIDTVTTDGELKVVFNLKSANAEFPARASLRQTGIMPEGASEFPKDAIGTGPWKVQEFKPGLSTLYVRNENYWREGLPYIDEIESIGIGDESARLDALLSGEVDLIEGLNAKAVKRVDASGVAKALVVNGGAHCTFPMRADTAPFTDINVRSALKIAFDRQKWVELAFDGLGEIGRDHPIPSFDPFFCKDIPIPEVDPEKVKFLLKKAGKEDFPFELHTSDGNYGGANAAVVLGELMKQNGVNITVKKDPADSYWSAVWMKVPWSASSWTVRPTAITRIEYGYLTNAPSNEAYWFEPKVDQLIADAKKELDESKRAVLLCDAQHIIAEQGGSIIPLFTPWIDAYSTKVQGLKGHPFLFLGMAQWAEVWLDA